MITVHRDKPNKDFLQIKNTHWMEFNKKYEPYALQLYLYLAKNADGYSFALSQKAAEEEVGIKKTSFHKYIDLLIPAGYLVRRSGNTYDFYETPHKQQKNEWSVRHAADYPVRRVNNKICPTNSAVRRS